MPSAYRCVFHSAESPALFAKHPEGRYYTPNEGGRTSYLAMDWRTAWIEVQRHLPTANPEAFDILEFEFETGTLVDVSNPSVAGLYGVDETILTGAGYESCPSLAHQFRGANHQGLFTYSAANRPDGRCIVLFEECLRPKQFPKLKSRKSVRAYLDESILP
jgi:RES domain-containing protein